MRNVALSSLIVAWLASAASAQVQQPPGPPAPSTPEAEAARLYEQGTVEYSLGKYDEAIKAFEDAYRLTKAPGFLYNIAQAYRQKGDCAQAKQLYQRYLKDEPSAPNRA